MKRQLLIKTLWLVTLLFGTQLLSTAQLNSISGKVVSKGNREPIPYATVTLLKSTDSSFLSGTITQTDGSFSINSEQEGSLMIEIRHMSYHPLSIKIEKGADELFLDTISLNDKAVDMKELVVVGERIKVKSDGPNTTYFMNKALKDATHNGLEVMKQLPGIKVDFMNNISLEGNGKTLFMINGVKRDMQSLKNMEAKKIKQVEINTNPGASYDGDVTGIINIVLKEPESGLDGSAYVEIPTSGKEVFITPKLHLNYATKKWSIYSAYAGEVSNFKISKRNYRIYKDNSADLEFSEYRDVRQNNWSHRVDLGVDIQLDTSRSLSFYSYYHPYSQEHDGRVELHASGSGVSNTVWNADKTDTDRNYAGYGSLLYRHAFSGRFSMKVKVDHYLLNSSNTTNYRITDDSVQNHVEITNSREPQKKASTMKLDFQSTLTHAMKAEWGAHYSISHLSDEQSAQFSCKRDILGAYILTKLDFLPFQINGGLRLEQTLNRLNREKQSSKIAVLPRLQARYQLDSENSFLLSFHTSVTRPSVFQLSPVSSFSDPYTLWEGNPELNHQKQTNLSLEYHTRFNNNFLSTGVFYESINDGIQGLTYLNEDGLVKTKPFNLEDIQRRGLKISGSLKIGDRISVNPYFRMYYSTTKPFDRGVEEGLVSQTRLSMQGSLSAIASLPAKFYLSASLQYQTPEYYLQHSMFSDPLYFVSLEKNFSERLKAGLTSGIPFQKSFVYYGTKTATASYDANFQGKIHTSGFPLWLKLSYSLPTKNKSEKARQDSGHTEKIPRKGF